MQLAKKECSIPGRKEGILDAALVHSDSTEKKCQDFKNEQQALFLPLSIPQKVIKITC